MQILNSNGVSNGGIVDHRQLAINGMASCQCAVEEQLTSGLEVAEEQEQRGMAWISIDGKSIEGKREKERDGLGQKNKEQKWHQFIGINPKGKSISKPWQPSSSSYSIYYFIL